MTWRSIAAVLLAGALLAGCGESDEGDDSATISIDQDQEAAANPSRSQFPTAEGKSLRELAAGARPGPNVAAATSVFVTGRNRLAFGLLSQDAEFIYAPTAVYLARTPNSPASGPILAPADSLITEQAFRSKNAALEGDAIASIYSTEVDLPRPGRYSLLVLSAVGGQLLGATGQLAASSEDRIPAAGDPAPEIDTDTTADVADVSEIETREPPDTMHQTSFSEVIGERPVALLMSTPALCESRVCGPVTDIAEQLKADYGDEVEFIHQEVFVDNDPNKGYRPQLQAFNLRTEPWLFTFDRDGKVAVRLEGSFGVESFEDAVQKAIEQ